MAALLFVCCGLSAAIEVEPYPSNQVALVAESAETTLTWPTTVDLFPLFNPKAGTTTYTVSVVNRQRNLILNPDAFSSHVPFDGTAIDQLPGPGTGAVGYQYCYYQGYTTPSAISAYQAHLMKHGVQGENILTAIDEGRKLWSTYLKARVVSNLQLEAAKHKLTVSADDVFLIDETPTKLQKEWRAETKTLGDDFSIAINPRRSAQANPAMLNGLHKDASVYITKYKPWVDASKSSGFHMYNVWIALSDIECQPLAIVTDSVGNVVQISNMNIGDYVLFNTYTVQHAGTALRPSDLREKDDLDCRVSVDFRFFVKFEKKSGFIEENEILVKN